MKTEQELLKTMQELRSKSDRKLLNTIDEMLEGVQILDENLNYLYINKAEEKQDQRPKDELLGPNYKDSWPGFEKIQVLAIMHQCFIEQNNKQFENEFLFPDGSKGCFYLITQPINEGIPLLSLEIDREQQSFELKRDQSTSDRIGKISQIHYQ